MKLLWICSVWPEPTSSAAGVRTSQLLLASKEAGFDVFAASSCSENKFKHRLESSGIKTKSILLNDSSFDQYLEDIRPEIVIFDRFMTEEQFSFRVKQTCPEALTVLDTIDLHHRRDKDLKLRELASIIRSDITLVVSDVERQYLINNFPVKDIFHVPFWVTPLEDPPKFYDRKNMVFIGNFYHPPNREALSIIQNEIAPKVSCEVHIYGAYAKSFKKDNLICFGFTDDSVKTLSKYRVSLAPLLTGSGIKGKILDSFAAGTPVATTKVGAEGIGEFGVENVLERALTLYENQSDWERAQRLGFSILNERFSRELCLERFFNALKTKKAPSFLNELLWFQTLRSTEYFSRWIEAKNKLSG